jgi:tRNA U38,U39,U40 pseudouridine synthase TruA
MVRLMAGTLVEVGLGRTDPVRIEELLVSRDGCEKGGPTLPPRGLFLVRITYEDEQELLCAPEFPALNVFGSSLVRVP